MGKKGAFLYFYFVAILLTFVLAIVTIIIGLGSNINPHQGGLLPILGLGIPALIFANLICTMYWNIRWKIWGWIPLIAILANYSYINSMYQFTINQPKKNLSEQPITIISYNVHGFRSTSTTYDLDDILQLMSKKADIVCFQEYAEDSYCEANKVRQKMKSFPYYVVKKNCHRGFGLAIYSKFPIKNETNIPFKNSLNGSMWADIAIGKQTIRLFNSHLQTTNINQTKDLLRRTTPEGFYASKKFAVEMIVNKMTENAQKRADQVDHLKQIMDSTKCPILFCGDFNDTPTSYAYHQINEKLKDGFVSAGNGFGNTFRYFHKLLRIDYVFHSNEFKAYSYNSPSIDFSDHNPVIIGLTLHK